ncbi:MAG: RpoL/Rpb11 RNA polymerase subunit family protein [Candidatus Hodarchaeota archaeon]
MELKRLREEPNLLEVEVTGETHTFLNLFREALKDIDSVLFAAYKIRHPVLASPMMVIRTDGVGIDPVVAVEQAAQAIVDWADRMLGLIESQISEY